VAELDAKHKQAQEELRKKTSSLGANVQQRALGLRERANSMRQQTQSKLRELDDLETTLPLNESKIKNLSGEIDQLLERMNKAYDVIDKREKFYRTCSL
jgi:chromosome segregation ATPase